MFAPGEFGVAGKHQADSLPLTQPLLRCRDSLLHLGGFIGGIGTGLALGIGAKAAMAGDVAQRHGEFRSGQPSLQGLGAQTPRIQTGPLQRVTLCIVE